MALVPEVFKILAQVFDRLFPLIDLRGDLLFLGVQAGALLFEGATRFFPGTDALVARGDLAVPLDGLGAQFLDLGEPVAKVLLEPGHLLFEGRLLVLEPRQKFLLLAEFDARVAGLQALGLQEALVFSDPPVEFLRFRAQFLPSLRLRVNFPQKLFDRGLVVPGLLVEAGNLAKHQVDPAGNLAPFVLKALQFAALLGEHHFARARLVALGVERPLVEVQLRLPFALHAAQIRHGVLEVPDFLPEGVDFVASLKKVEGGRGMRAAGDDAHLADDLAVECHERERRVLSPQ